MGMVVVVGGVVVDEAGIWDTEGRSSGICWHCVTDALRKLIKMGGAVRVSHLAGDICSRHEWGRGAHMYGLGMGISCVGVQAQATVL